MSRSQAPVDPFDDYVNPRSSHDVDVAPTRPASQVAWVNVAGNPFLTDARGRASPKASPSGGPEAQARKRDHHAQMDEHATPLSLDLEQDPFMTKNAKGLLPKQEVQSPSRVEELGHEVEAIKEKVKHWSESAYAMLGPGDRDRKNSARSILVVIPVLIFVWELLIWMMVQHISTNACWLITMTLAITSSCAVMLWYLGIRWGSVSLLALGSLCLVAVILGTCLGRQGWSNSWQEFWWMNIGQQLIESTAATPASARSDAASLSFHNDSTTSVDASRAAGFKDTDLFCVAPIMSPETAGAEFGRVNFWAVGINCCTKYGVFTCDNSREPGGAYGIVQLQGGYPCPSCNNDKFRKAVSKAEAMYGLVSAPDALFVRWVESPGRAKLICGLWAVGYLVLCIFLGSIFLQGLGFIAWYYGIGRRAPNAGVSISYGFQEGEEMRAKRLQ
eukprot:TRINITY_DN56662_c0_g1_i1.p1 TRINITY_DN56662_c0_g1~~TRINITY_DN56662_c0_g1_i1.p1  ORF type:complete len:445 (-),score=67.75 TRINITY_DN56662_c0_g1_i1:33-1367(-)